MNYATYDWIVSEIEVSMKIDQCCVPITNCCAKNDWCQGLCLREEVCDLNTRNVLPLCGTQREMNNLYERDEPPALTMYGDQMY